MNTFTIAHLWFTVAVDTTIVMDVFKGSALRGAWQSHLRTLYCAQSDQTDPLHQSLCPVCFLLSRETGSGEDRRPYAFLPPLTSQTTFAPGERFAFGISLFGQTVDFLPYLVLAVGQMGQVQGLGKPIHATTRGRYRRGTFHLVSIEEINPLSGERRFLLEEGSTMVQTPRLLVDEHQIVMASDALLEKLAAGENRLAIHFLTPMRIVQDRHLVKQPRFTPFLARLLDRVSALRSQFSQEPPLSREEKGALLALASRVDLVVDATRWWDIKGRSTRLQRAQPLGGFVGRVVYQAPNTEIWRPLLPWLLWGQSTQVGKNVVKGCGWYVMESSGAILLPESVKDSV
ncbi:MAG: CRISPR system precrRNA processing endoribonuclease RAMP protein Cas6 [Nitrospinota bacterium]|nr:MAG: CRISPR system precrRNA processing endoribonuclease RAMP protein Cas6 [Nitrospinota bacterium]